LSQRDLERNVKRKFTRTLVASVQDKDASLVFSGPSTDTGDVIAQTVSPSGKFTVVLRSVAGEKKRDFVEVREQQRTRTLEKDVRTTFS
jgi:acylaminoacyl-peptidase